MAEDIKINPALASDPSKIGVYGASQEQLSEYQKSLQDQIKALEKRYENPNWFKVAAGFLKPQLGGFAASLGSANEAFAEQIEQQRASAIPIAQMRAQLAQSNILLDNKSKAAQMAKEWQDANPDQPIPPGLMEKIAGRDKDLAERLGMGVKQNLEQRTLSQKEQEQAISLLTLKRANLENLAKNGQIAPAVFKQQALDIDRQIGELQRVGPFGNPTRNIPNAGGLAPNAAPSADTTFPSNVPGAQAAPAPVAAPAAPAVAQATPMGGTPTSGGAPARRAAPEGMLPEVHPKPSVNYAAMNDLEKEQSRIDMKNAQDRALADDKEYQGQYHKLSKFSSAIGDAQAITRAKETIQKMAKADPAGFHKLTDSVREAGPLAAAVNDGFAFHAGSLAANISLPVSTYLAAGLDPSKRTDYDRLLNSFAVLASAGMHNEGVTPQSYVNHPGALQAAMRKYAGVGQTGPAAYTIAMQNALKFQEQIELAKLVEHEFKNRTNKNSQARYADAFSSPKVKELREIFDEQSRALNRASDNRSANRSPR